MILEFVVTTLARLNVGEKRYPQFILSDFMLERIFWTQRQPFTGLSR
jgi:hypothetical protein